MTKYNAKKTVIDGITFASRLEGERFKQLKLLQQAGEIEGLSLQDEFQIARGWINPETGEKIKSAFYVADFTYFDNRTKRWIVEDTKGMETADFRLKWKLVQSQYRDYEFRKVTRDMV